MSALLNWIDDRTGLGGLVRNYLYAPIPGRPCGCRVWPATIAFAFCVQAITGFVIWAYYSPSTQTAWESVYFLQHQVAGGWLLRAMHHWSAQVLLVLLALYLIQMIVTGAYRAPRELIFCTALLMMLVTLGLLLTGDLLAWDQNSYASTQVRVSFLELLPGIGGGLYKLAAGGPQFGHLTLTRFLALHVCCMSGSLLLLLVLHVLLVRRADSARAATAEKTFPFWPKQAALNAAAMAVVLVVVLVLSVQNGVWGEQRGIELGSPADTSSFFSAARPEWAFLGLYEFSHMFPGSIKILPIFVIPGLLVLAGMAIPWIARFPGGHLFNLTLAGALLAGVTILSVVAVRKDLNNGQHQAALKAEQGRARRAVQLARAQGIPATGALTLLRNDPKTQGPTLFKTHCACCHDYAGGGPDDIGTREPTAPNLYGYASRKWVAGWLDPKTITGPDYLGNTKFRRGEMVENLEALYDSYDEDELDELKEDLAILAAGLSGEAGLKSQEELEEKEASQVSHGKVLIDEFGCIECHKFHDKGSLGEGPDLTGYGSREWTVAIIANAADKRFYGKDNDGMPAYAEFPHDPAKNTLSARDIGLLADWLRGEWFED